MIQTTSIDLQFTEGTDSKTDSKNTAYTSFTTLQNSRYSKIGVVVPRGGFSLVGLNITSASSSGDNITADNDHIVTKNSESLYTIGAASTSIKIGSELAGGYKRLYGGDALPLINTVSSQTFSGTTYVVQVWATADNATTGRVGVAVYDATTDRVVAKGTSNLFAVRSLQLVTTSTGAMYLIAENASFDLLAYDINVFATSTSGIINSNFTWANSPTGTTAMRWAATASGSTFTVIWAEDDSVNVKMQQFSSFNTAPAPTTVLTFANPARALAITPVATQGSATVMIAASCSVTPTIAAKFYTNTGTLVGTQQTLSSAGPGHIRSWAFETATTPIYGYTFTASGLTTTVQYSITSSSISAQTSYQVGVIPVSAPTAGSVMLLDSYTEPTYGSQAMISMIQGTQSSLGTMGIGMNLGQLLDSEAHQLDRPVVVGTKTYFTSPVIAAVDGFLPPSGAISKTTLTPKIQASLILYDSSELLPTQLERSKQQSLYMGGTTRVLGAAERTGTPWPEMTTTLSSLSLVAGAHPISTISYVFAKVWKSAEGVEYRAYSTIYTVVHTASSALQYNLKTTDFTTYNPSNPVTSVEMYRTTENGILFYLAETRTAAGTYTDASLDTVIVGARTADLNGNELPPQAIPSIRAITSWGDRIAFVGPDKPSTVLFDRPSFYPVGTSSANGLEVEVPSEGGDITALQDMDSALYVFKDNAVFTIYGDPAGATGENSTLSVPKILFNGTGCVDPRSVLLTPKGIVFKSGKGFYLIARNQALTFIGQGPFSVLTTSCVGAQIAQNQYEAYFAHANGTIWTLNLDTMAWYDWLTTHSTRGLATSSGSLLSIGEIGVYRYMESNTSDPIGGAIPQDIRTGWVRMNHVRGFQRIRRAYIVGSCTVSCALTVRIYTDYNAAPVQTFSFNITPTDPLELDLHMAVQKCEAMSFRFTTDKAGLTISGATLEVGIKEGPDKSRTSASNLK